jgi:hypothetical protein
MFGVHVRGQLDLPAAPVPVPALVPAPTSLLLLAPSLSALNHPVGLAAAAYRDLQERSSSTSVFHSHHGIGLGFE